MKNVSPWSHLPSLVFRRCTGKIFITLGKQLYLILSWLVLVAHFRDVQNHRKWSHCYSMLSFSLLYTCHTRCITHNRNIYGIYHYTKTKKVKINFSYSFISTAIAAIIKQNNMSGKLLCEKPEKITCWNYCELSFRKDIFYKKKVTPCEERKWTVFFSSKVFSV